MQNYINHDLNFQRRDSSLIEHVTRIALAFNLHKHTHAAAGRRICTQRPPELCQNSKKPLKAYRVSVLVYMLRPCLCLPPQGLVFKVLQDPHTATQTAGNTHTRAFSVGVWCGKIFGGVCVGDTVSPLPTPQPTNCPPFSPLIKYNPALSLWTTLQWVIFFPLFLTCT